MKSITKWFLFNGVFAACLYFGFIEGIDGAKNVSVFLAYLVFICSLLALSDVFIEELAKKLPVMPRWIDVTFDICVMLTFIWFGYIVTGILFGIGTLLIQMGISKAIELNEKSKPNE